VYFHQIKVARPVGRRLASSPGEADRRIHSVGPSMKYFRALSMRQQKPCDVGEPVCQHVGQ